MGPKKRKAESTGLDEMDRELYQRFRAAASSVSALYTSSLNLQKRAFNGGARHTTEKLLQWALSQQASGEKPSAPRTSYKPCRRSWWCWRERTRASPRRGTRREASRRGHPRIETPARRGGTRAHLAALDANSVRPISRVSPRPHKKWVFTRRPPPRVARRLRSRPSTVQVRSRPLGLFLFIQSPAADPFLARLRREQEYEQGLGAKLGQAFTQHAPSPGAHTRSSGHMGARATRRRRDARGG